MNNKQETTRDPLITNQQTNTKQQFRGVSMSLPYLMSQLCGLDLNGEHSIINIAEIEHREMDGGRRLACDTSKRALQPWKVSVYLEFIVWRENK